jgi:hypothetical protein
MPRVQALEKVADTAPLAGCVASLEEGDEATALVLYVRLQFEKLELQPDKIRLEDLPL